VDFGIRMARLKMKQADLVLGGIEAAVYDCVWEAAHFDGIADGLRGAHRSSNDKIQQMLLRSVLHFCERKDPFKGNVK
jgi:hypothetical protein